MDSPVSNNGRGLKRNNGRGLKHVLAKSGHVGLKGDSPVSNNGRGLKHHEAAYG